MTTVDRAAVERVLSADTDPCLGSDLVSAGALRGVRDEGTALCVDLTLGFPHAGYAAALRERVGGLLGELAGGRDVVVRVDTEIGVCAVQGGLQPLPGVKNIIAVASGKGGVGKSTTALNLALALNADGARVGLLDADIYGPSQPRMLGLRGARPGSPDGKTLEPLQAHGIRCMSIGFLVDEEQPMVWRGPMVTQALNQLANDTRWGELDYLLVDMPPGTGDIQLTLAQRVPVSGAVIITTPQDIALLDARKGLKMFEKVEVAVLGIIENMSVHVCPKCGHEEHIFGAGGGERMAADYGTTLLGELPLDIRIREESDAGTPVTVIDPGSAIGQRYRDIARRMTARLSLLGGGEAFPRIVVDDD